MHYTRATIQKLSASFLIATIVAFQGYSLPVVFASEQDVLVAEATVESTTPAPAPAPEPTPEQTAPEPESQESVPAPESGSQTPENNPDVPPSGETGDAPATQDQNPPVPDPQEASPEVPDGLQGLSLLDGNETSGASTDSTIVPEIESDQAPEETPEHGEEPETTPEESLVPLPSGPSGEESAAGQGGLIATGDARAVSNVLNAVNTNIVNAEGLISFINFLRPMTEDFLLSDYFAQLSAAQQNGCDAECLRSISIANQNKAEVDNAVTVTASTGRNTIENGGRGSTIATGDAFAAANTINFVNTNIVDSQYLLLVVNSLGDFTGNLVLPGRSFFEEFLARHGGGQPSGASSIAISNENEASVENVIDTEAQTGANQADSGTIVTGDARAISNTLNYTNSNFTNAAPFMILVRVMGNWSGNLFSVPDGISWERTPEGVVLYSAGSDPFGTCCGASSSLSISNANQASVRNNVKVFALTGENEIEGDGGTVVTGNAYAINNTVNVVNSNIVGRNWTTALVTIAGDWNGNLSFGRPDLWVGSRAFSPDNPMRKNSGVDFTIDVVNRGDADATDVEVVARHSVRDRLRVSRAGNDGAAGNDEVRWRIPSLRAGASVSLTYSAATDSGLPPGITPVIVEVSAASHEDDANANDNADSMTIMLQGDTTVWGGSGAPSPYFLLTKTSSPVATTTPSSTVKYTITVKNSYTETLYNAVLYDALEDPDGTVLDQGSWDLGEMTPGEEVVVDYEVNFGAGAKGGSYVNYAMIEARNANGQVLPPVETSHVIKLERTDPVIPGAPGAPALPATPPPSVPHESALPEEPAQVRPVSSQSTKKPGRKVAGGGASVVTTGGASSSITGSIPHGGFYGVAHAADEPEDSKRLLAALGLLVSEGIWVVAFLFIFLVLVLIFAFRRRRENAS